MKLNCDIGIWEKCDPIAMANRQSRAGIEYVLEDAKHDILALARQNAELEAKLAKAVKDAPDARRYRYLRNDWSIGPCVFNSPERETACLIDGEVLDVHVDAAIAAQEKKP